MSAPSYKHILRVSYPIILGGIGQTIINITDSAFLGRVSETALGASAIGGLLYVTFMMLCFGFGVGVQIIIARLNGERNHAAMGSVIDHAFYFMCVISLFLFMLINVGGSYVLQNFVQSKPLLYEALSFIKIRSYAIFFASFLFVIRAFFIGIAQTRMVMYTTGIVAVFNIILNYIFVFGHAGFQPMGVSGSALASTLSEFIAAIFALAYTLKTVDVKKYQLFAYHRFEKEKLMEVIAIAVPVMFQMFISLCSWFIFFMIVEKMGERALAISNIIRNAYMILMIPLVGFSSATNTLVSTLVGEGKLQELNRLIKKIAICSLSLTLLLMLLLNIQPELMLGIFTNNKTLIEQTVPSLYVIDGSLLLFSVSIILLSAVSGMGKTLMSLSIEVITIIFYLFATYLVAVVWHMPIAMVWGVEYVYFFFMATASLLCIKWIARKSMRS